MFATVYIRELHEFSANLEFSSKECTGMLISFWPDQEGNNLIFLSEWYEFPSAPCLARKETWQLASRFCWNRVCPCHATVLVSFVAGLRTYQHLIIYGFSLDFKMDAACLNNLEFVAFINYFNFDKYSNLAEWSPTNWNPGPSDKLHFHPHSITPYSPPVIWSSIASQCRYYVSPLWTTLLSTSANHKAVEELHANAQICSCYKEVRPTLSKFLGDFMFPPRCKRRLCSSAILCSVAWWLVTAIFGKTNFSHLQSSKSPRRSAAKPSQSANWGAETCAKRSRRPPVC